MSLVESLINRKRAEAKVGSYITLKDIRELVASSQGLSDETIIYIQGTADNVLYKNWQQFRAIMAEQYVREDNA